MNKDLDHLFEQARKSMQSEMPLEEVQGLIHGQASPSLWTKKTTWIMSTSIMGILTIGIACWFNSYQQPITTTAMEISKESSLLLQQQNLIPQPTVALPNATPDNIPLPVLHQEKIIPNSVILTSFEKEHSKTNFATKENTKLDSLGPKKTFTEYKLEIKKENSEQEIKKLKSELSNYGIHMDVKILSYDTDNKIKRFKGKFKTDSLFCGSTMNDYEFDISGAFKSMEFIFRVADNKNLKYLKIQSENFEETIECYDDEVISNTQEARKISRQIQKEMAKSQQEMANAQIEMANAQQKIARAQEEMTQLQKENYTKDHIKRLEKRGLMNWDKIEEDVEKAMENIEIELEDVNVDLIKILEDMEGILSDKTFKGDMKILQKDLDKMRIKIEREVIGQLQGHQLNAYENEVTIIKNAHQSSDNRERTAEELKEEATAMEEAAKELKREAKEKRKMAKKKEKNK